MQEKQLELPHSEPSQLISNQLEKDESRAECSLEDLLTLESLCARGEITSTMERGTILYATSTSPRYLESITPTRISYLSRLFSQWHGDLEFTLIVTKAIFQQCKLLMVFVPDVNPAGLRAIPLDSLMGYQMRTIMNPDNNACATLKVPFISRMQWLSTEEATGSFAVILAEKIVVTQQTDSPISFMLNVRSPSGSSQMRFRYAVVPPITISGGGGAGGGGSGITPPVENTVSKYAQSVGQAYASSSTGKRRSGGSGGSKFISSLAKVINPDAMYITQPVFGAPQALKSGVAIPFASISNTQLAASRLAQLSLAPPFAFDFDAPVARKSIVPYLPCIQTINGPLPNTQEYDWFLTASNNSIEGDYVWFGQSFESWYMKVKMPSREIAASFDGWYVMCVYRAKDNNTHLLRLKAINENRDEWVNLKYQSVTQAAQFVGLCFRVGTPIYFVDDPVNYRDSYKNLSIVPFLKRQLDTAKSLQIAGYFNIYCTGSTRSAEAIKRWIVDPSDSAVPPKLVQGNYISFSMSQAPAYFNLVPKEERGIFTWIYSLFSTNQDTPLFKLARVADIIFDLVVPLIVAFDGEPPSFDISDPKVTFDRVEIGVSRIVADEVRMIEVEIPDEEIFYGIKPPSEEDLVEPEPEGPTDRPRAGFIRKVASKFTRSSSNTRAHRSRSKEKRVVSGSRSRSRTRRSGRASSAEGALDLIPDPDQKQVVVEKKRNTEINLIHVTGLRK